MRCGEVRCSSAGYGESAHPTTHHHRSSCSATLCLVLTVTVQAEGLPMASDDVVIVLRARSVLHSNRGQALMSLQFWRRAIKDLSEALEVDPLNGKALWRRYKVRCCCLKFRSSCCSAIAHETCLLHHLSITCEVPSWTAYNADMIAYCSLLTAHCSLLTAYCVLHTTHYLLLSMQRCLLTVFY